MNKTFFPFFLFLFFSSIKLQAQLIVGAPAEKKYKFSEVYNPDYGINIYEKLIAMLGGDSIRNDKRGYAAQGWMEDHYESGKLMHKGYYADGKIKLFKNFYENGQVERDYKLTDLLKSRMNIFYEDGKPRAEIEYNEESVLKEVDYYSNGNIEYTEEMSKGFDYLLYRKSFYEDGKPESVFELTDKKKRIYSKKEYYTNGNLKEEGAMIYNESSLDYIKEGSWKTYNEAGQLLTEDIYIGGEFNKKVK